MSFLLVTIPVSLLLSACLLAVVIHAIRSGAFDDWDGPAERLVFDDDATPEIDAVRYGPADVPEARDQDPARGAKRTQR